MLMLQNLMVEHCKSDINFIVYSRPQVCNKDTRTTGENLLGPMATWHTFFFTSSPWKLAVELPCGIPYEIGKQFAMEIRQFTNK